MNIMLDEQEKRISRKMNMQKWIDDKLKEIAQKLPDTTHTEPSSFACGYNVGYKQAILDIQKIMDDERSNLDSKKELSIKFD